MAKIEHVFVLMLENRSFDHLLAFSGLSGISPPPPNFGFAAGAVDQLANDPPHEYENVAAQIHDGAMDGFRASGGDDTMLGFDASEIPVLVELAKNNLCFDNWFSSMPGPTWPNRLFAHAASSGGLDNSMGSLDTIGAVTNPGFNLNFTNGHIFDRLTARGVTWRVYDHHGFFDFDYPQVLALKGMIDKRNDPKFFRNFSDLASDLSSGDTVGYTFIEPKYGLPSFARGNSQHPTGTISLGDMLIRDTYNAIFKQKIGANSALLITWDEHGGFFDHVTPPVAVPPGDDPLNHARAQHPQDCHFDRFGVRVPAVLISPWLPAGLGSNIFGPNATFDHSSIVKALRSTFSLGPKLTNRDDASPDWNAAILSTPRALQQTLPAVARARFRTPEPSLQEVAARGEPSGNMLGTAQIAADIDWHTAERLHVPPLIVSDFGPRLAHAERVSMQGNLASTDADQSAAHLSVLEYIKAVQARDAKLKAAEQRKSAPVKPVKKRAAKKPAKPPARKRSAVKRSGKPSPSKRRPR